MTETSPAAHWDRVYATRAADSVSWYEASPEPSLAWIERMGLDHEAPIVDVGTGLSHLPDRLLALGFVDVTLVDVSAEAIARGNERRRLAGLGPPGGLEAFVGDVTAWRPQQRFRLWHDRAVLHFLVNDAERAAYRRALEAAVLPGGNALIATFALDGPERCSGLPVRRYGGDDLAALCGPAFRLVESRSLDHRTPGGAVQRFHWGWLRRAGARDGHGNRETL